MTCENALKLPPRPMLAQPGRAPHLLERQRPPRLGELAGEADLERFAAGDFQPPFRDPWLDDRAEEALDMVDVLGGADPRHVAEPAAPDHLLDDEHARCLPPRRLQPPGAAGAAGAIR